MAGHHPVMWWDHPEGPMVEAAPSLVLLRSGADVQLDRAERLARSGLPVLNEPMAHRRSRDKLVQAQVYLAASVPHPATVGVGDGVAVSSVPLVAKPRQGSSGDGVRLITEDAVDAALATGDLVQQRILDAEEYRVTVVDGRDVAWARKVPAAGEFRANLDLGARMVAARRPDAAAASVACAAVEALGLDIGGVDLMVGRSGPVVLEVNAATTLHGADAMATRRILGAVVELCDAVARNR